MSDRELLELAAKAAGIKLDWDIPERARSPWRLDEDGNSADIWNPLADDGDALRLAVKLSLIVNIYNRLDGRGVTAVSKGWAPIQEPHHEGAEASTRRAIVRAAAEIAKGML